MLLTFDDALRVIRRLVEVAEDRGEPVGSPIVLVGGTAMAAWQIRQLSNDVDLYAPVVPQGAVEQVEEELRGVYGPAFRLDVTAGENVWGAILLRDIASSPQVEPRGALDLRALRVEDLFLLKLAASRARDLEDLELIAARTNVDALVDRWNVLVKWHGDRRAILGFADALVAQAVRLYGVEAAGLIARLDVTDGQRQALVERAIRDEELALAAAARLLAEKVSIEAWPEIVREALRLALDDAGLAGPEAWKVVTLRRHLFGPLATVPASLAASTSPSGARRLAERLRADLPALTQLRAGAYLAAR